MNTHTLPEPRSEPALPGCASGMLLLAGTVGSTAYGLATATSDIDTLGVYATDPMNLFGMSAASHADATSKGTSPDYTYHEVAKFLRLACQANPTVMELLWLPSYRAINSYGQMLIDVRDSCLSTTRVRDAYGGYAVAQARRLLNRHVAGKSGFSADLGNRTAKHGRHCFRLMIAGAHLLRTGTLLVDMSEHRQELFRVGELAADDPTAFEALFTKQLERMNNVRSVLADQPDRDTIERVLRAIRADMLLHR